MYIVWFRQDLRLADHPALQYAAAKGIVLPIYILEDTDAGSSIMQMGAASRVWLHHALNQLNQQLNQQLHLFEGKAQDIIHTLCTEHDIQGVYWNRCYEPWRIQRDQQIKQDLLDAGIDARSFNGSLLWEPWKVLKADGTPYKVFTPYYRKGCLKTEPRAPQNDCSHLQLANVNTASIALDALDLLPSIPWHKSMVEHWTISEQGAQDALNEFLQHRVQSYREGRNFPAKQHVSRLSPYLHFGHISPHQVWHAATQTCPMDEQLDTFCSELGWREFSYYLLYHFPELPDTPLQVKFKRFPWHAKSDMLSAWQRGQTGYPIVDAGMRELWQTGYMHNRVRMIVGSFLVKNLLIRWQAGAAWFWDCLVDADLASNSASWQWVAGCGADAAPYFRIFNPVTQGEKFDADGEYTKHYVPELAQLPKQYLFKPWAAPNDILIAAGIELGKHYPQPIVDIKLSRTQALDAWQQLKTKE